MKQAHKPINTRIIAIMAAFIIVVASLTLGVTYKSVRHPEVLSDQTSEPGWDIYGPTDSAPAGTNNVMSAKILPLDTYSCTDSVWRDITITLHEAFLINQSFLSKDTLGAFLPGLRMQNADVTYDFNRFLIVYGFVTHETISNTPHSGLFVDRFLRIIRPDSLRKPMQFGGTNLGPVGQPTPFWAVFPLKKNEVSMTVLFCNFQKPTVVPLDFSTGSAQSIEARYNPL